MEDLKTRLKEEMAKRKVKFPQLASETGINKEKMYKWFSENTNPKYEDAIILEKWMKGEKVEKVPHGTLVDLPERSLENLTESNKVLAEANRTLAEANKTLAEANHVISKNHDELIQLTKMIVANSQVLPRIQTGALGPESQAPGTGFVGVSPSGNRGKSDRPEGKH